MAECDLPKVEAPVRFWYFAPVSSCFHKYFNSGYLLSWFLILPNADIAQLVEQHFRKVKVASSNLAIGSKYIIKNMLNNFLDHILDKYIRIIISLTIIFNVLLWFLWIGHTTEPVLPLYFSTFVIVLNFTISQFSFGREKLASYLLTGFSLFIQVLMLIFIRNIIILQQ